MIWYINSLKPCQTLKLNKRLTKFMFKNHKKGVFLTRWHHLQLMTHTQKSYQKQLIATQINTIKKLFTRQCRRSFDIWKNCKGAKKEGLRQVLRFMNVHLNERRREAMLKW